MFKISNTSVVGCIFENIIFSIVILFCVTRSICMSLSTTVYYIIFCVPVVGDLMFSIHCYVAPKHLIKFSQTNNFRVVYTVSVSYLSVWYIMYWDQIKGNLEISIKFIWYMFPLFFNKTGSLFSRYFKKLCKEGALFKIGLLTFFFAICKLLIEIQFF